MEMTAADADLAREVLDGIDAHVKTVRILLRMTADDLEDRARHHDRSKYGPDEFSAWVEVAKTRQLHELEYGSADYRALLKTNPAIPLHYQRNDHHPEHFAADGKTTADGAAISRMSLPQLEEMLCDWYAATKRMQGGGDFMQSLEHNKTRFGIGAQLYRVLVATARARGWVEESWAREQCGVEGAWDPGREAAT